MLRLLFFLQLSLFLSVSAHAQINTRFTVFFDVNSSNIDNLQLQGLMSYLDTIPKVHIFSISIVGYTDDTGSKELNDKLSADRAAMISMFLKNTNFPINRIVGIAGKGVIPLIKESDLTAEEQRKYNRRVELIIELNQFSNQNILFKTPPNVGDIYVLPMVHFKTGSHKLLPESFQTMSYLLFYLREHEELQITLMGHVCCLQINEDAMDFDTGIRNLSEARAEVIYDFLIKNGIEKKRLSYSGMRAEFPLGEGDDKDRRVEIYVNQI